MGDQLNSEHAVGELANFVECFCKLDAAGLAATTSMDLCLNDPEITAQFFGRLDGRICRISNYASRHRDSVVGKQPF